MEHEEYYRGVRMVTRQTAGFYVTNIHFPIRVYHGGVFEKEYTSIMSAMECIDTYYLAYQAMNENLELPAPDSKGFQESIDLSRP